MNQQHALLNTQAIQEETPRRTPKEAFQQDLHQIVADLVSQEHPVIIGGDFNTTFGSEANTLERMASECGLIDIMVVQHQDPTIPVTYCRGKERIDFILLCKSLQSSVNACGYEAFNRTFPSNHRGMFIDFDTTSLFRLKPSPL